MVCSILGLKSGCFAKILSYKQGTQMMLNAKKASQMYAKRASQQAQSLPKSLLIALSRCLGLKFNLR